MRHVLTGLALVAMLLAVGSSPLLADDKGIHLDGAWARRAGGGGQSGSGQSQATGRTSGDYASGKGMNGAVYVKISNHGKARDALVSAATDAAEKVELHATINDGGVMRMRPQAKLEVAPGKALEMKPGGYHIMLLGLNRDLKPGDTVTLTLTFEKAGQMAVEAPVK